MSKQTQLLEVFQHDLLSKGDLMKILIAHYKYYVQGGPERYMFKFMKLAERYGCEVIPFSVNYKFNEKSKYSEYFVGSEESGGNYDASNHKLSYLIKNAWHEFHNKEATKKLKQLIKVSKPDVLYVLIPGQLTADIFKVAHKANIPVLLRISDFRNICGNNILLSHGKICEDCIHGNYLSCFKKKCVKNSKSLSLLRSISLKYNRLRNRYRYVDAVITPPIFTANKLIESGFFPKEKIHNLPTFVDTNLIKQSTIFGDYVLCLGRFSPEKGFDCALKSLQYLKDLPIKVAITGLKADCDDRILGIINDLDIEKQVMFVGFLSGNDLVKISSECLCVVCPAIWYENMPNVILEAFAYGKPVIATNIGSLSEIVHHEQNGLLFNRNDDKDLANCIRRVYTDYDLRNKLGNNARHDAETLYSPENHFNGFLDIYHSLKEGD